MSLPAYPTGLLGPATHCFLIVPNDNVALDPMPKMLRADGAGAVVLRFKDSPADVTLTMVAGETVRGLISHVRATGTAAIPLHGFA